MNIYFAGVGGIAIGPLALLAKDMGNTAVGSDQSPSRYSKIIESNGIEVFYDQSGEALRKAHTTQAIDWYVYTSALPGDNPELIMAHELGIKTSKRDELLNYLLKEKNLKLIAISGTHGKTTTTAMLIWLFDQLKIPFAHLVGTNLSFAPSGRYQPGAEWMIYEADEYDRNMLHFHPDIAVIPSLDYDHPDTYPTPETYREAFREFISKSQRVVTWQSIAKSLGVEGQPNVSTVSDDNDLSNLELVGEYNRKNGFLVATTVLAMKISTLPVDKILDIIEAFPGSERRFEKIAENLYSDYAHHPAEIRATIELAREIARDKKIVVVYQPHQNLRQHEIIDKYQDCFSGANQLYWLPTYLSRENKELPILRPAELIARLSDKPPTEIVELNDSLAGIIRNHLAQQDLVLVIGAGSVDEWLRQHFTP